MKKLRCENLVCLKRKLNVDKQSPKTLTFFIKSLANLRELHVLRVLLMNIYLIYIDLHLRHIHTIDLKFKFLGT